MKEPFREMMAGEAPESRRAGRGSRFWIVLESLAVFAVGFGMLTFMYSGTGGVLLHERGVPGNDDFYHIKMAVLLPQIGLVGDFPWLKFCYFTEQGHEFVSHHYGFHALMVPFVYLSKWWTDDYLSGGRWAISTFFALTLVVFNLLLIKEGMRWRWLWLIVFLMLPSQFFGRQVFVRAISPSLLFMLLIILSMFRQRYVLTGLAVAAYNHLYLGAVIYSPVVVGCYVTACLIGPREDRCFPWKLVVSSLAGWVLGVITYPYFHGMMEFLWLQVFGTGLSPDISVGTEWKPYEGVWWFAQMSGPLLGVWVASLLLRVRLGPPLNAKETSLLLMNFAFLVLTMKARRFIEYWPMFCLLSAAIMAGPLINRLAVRVEEWFRSDEGTAEEAMKLIMLVLTAVGMAAMACAIGRRLGIQSFAVEWRLWSALAGGYIMVPLAGIWLGRREQGETWLSVSMRSLMFIVSGAVFTAAAAVFVARGIGYPPSQSPKLPIGYAGLIVLGMAYAVTAAIGLGISFPRIRATAQGRALRVLVVGLAVLAMVIPAGARPLVDRQRDTRCDYNLPAIRAAMDFLMQNSQPGDVIFTDDWDVFPVYFYYNSYNYYIVGLDPKFTQHREPELWERYVKITRGQTPTSVNVESNTVDKGKPETRKISVKLEDIREHFGARFIVTDRDHKPFARKLNDAKHFAELIYPLADYEKCKDDPYLIFRVRPEGEVTERPPEQAQDPGALYLSTLKPISVEQGYGEFQVDRSVEGGPLEVGPQVYAKGLGTHANSRLEYTIPEGYDTFLARVGVNRSTEGRGSIKVFVELDGKTVFTSPRLTGESEGVDVDVPLGNAKKLVLRADETDDGNRFDHVDWADARFLRHGEGS